jgi:membrane protein implicated in regulation of membrane protease activity
MAWVSAPLGGGMRVGSRIPGTGRGGGGGGGSLLAVLFVMALIYGAVTWLIAHWWVLVIAAVVIVAIMLLIASARAEARAQASRWQVGHRIRNDQYEILVRQGTEEVLVRRIKTT